MMRALARARPSRLRARAGDLCWDARRDARRARVPLDAPRRRPRLVPRRRRREDARSRDFAAVMMRKDPPFDMEYVYSTYLLEAAEREGARVFNRPRAIRDHNEKMAIARVRRVHRADARHARRRAHRRVHRRARATSIVKPLDGMGGTSIFRVRADDPNRNVIVETVGAARRADGDGAALHPRDRRRRQAHPADRRRGRAVLRSRAFPKPGETRGNLAAGGRGVARPLTARDREIAAALGPALWAEGLLVVGLDVIGDYLTEVNVTSPTCFVEITAADRASTSAAMFAARAGEARPALSAAPRELPCSMRATCHLGVGTAAVTPAARPAWRHRRDPR